MEVIRQFCSAEELAQLVDLWRAGKGWEARGSYIFTPCLHPPMALVKRIEPYLPPSTSAPYTDSFFIHYVEQQALATHTDARSVVRLNVLVIEPEEGGILTIDGQLVPMKTGDAIVFNPNTQPHGVTRLTKGQRLLWSLGRTENEMSPIKILIRKLNRAKGKKPRTFFDGE